MSGNDPNNKTIHATNTNEIKHIYEEVAHIHDKVSAMFTKVDGQRKTCLDIQILIARLQERDSNNTKNIEKILEDMNGKEGIFDRLRLNENKLGKIFAIASALITAFGIAAIVIPLLMKD